MARITALVYNWWNLFARLAEPDKHLEAITSRPLLLNAPARQITHGRQRRLVISHQHPKPIGSSALVATWLPSSEGCASLRSS